MTREISFDVEVPGTPEQVWEAIATGPGITAWFVPAEIDGDRMVQRHGEGLDTTSRITASEKPRRFAYADEFQPASDAEPSRIATEFLVEARSGATCVVRLVQSGFGTGDAWERAIKSFTTGWPGALDDLRLYLTRFPGLHASGFAATRIVDAPRDQAWAAIGEQLGLPERPAPGDRVATTGGPRLAGQVTRVEDSYLSLLLEEPAPGFGFLGAGGPGEETHVFVRQRLFGDGAPEIAARAEAQWREWLAQAAREKIGGAA
jgi:uncharacterized protein YndB with AHSA1/START domain